MKRSLYFILFFLSIISCSTNTQQIVIYGCDFLGDINVGDQIECGQLEVPENHNNPAGRKISIAYVVIKAKDSLSSNFPMINFSGGPGGRSLSEGSINRWSESEYSKNRDIILFDQRGIGYSSLLENIGPALFDILAADVDLEKEKEMFADTIQSYKEKFIALGIDLASYNSFENAKDVAALMDHLGYGKYNLRGGSYGTRLARVVQEMFPEKVNSVILDSPNPMVGDFLVSRLHSYSLALQRVFDYCENSNECRTTYPNLRTQYLEIIESLKTNPIKVSDGKQVFYVNAQDALYLLRRRLYSSNSRESAPEFIDALVKKDTNYIGNAAQSERIGLIQGVNVSMLLSVENHEMFNMDYTSQVIDSIYETLPLFPEKLGFFTSLFESGKAWHNKRLSEEGKKFNISDLPTLVFVNQYDPVTPPEYGYIMQKELPNSELYILDQGGHGSINGDCATRVTIDFMDEPDISLLDASCLNLYKGNN